MMTARWWINQRRLRWKLQEQFSSRTSKAVRRDRLTYCSIRKLARLERCVDQAIKQDVPVPSLNSEFPV